MLTYSCIMPDRHNIKGLSVKQQLGLFVVLTKLYDKKVNRPFYSSDFSEAIKELVSAKDIDEYYKVVGGILGALSKNGILLKQSGDRDPLWTLADDIYERPGVYLEQLKHVPHVRVFWSE